MNIKRTTKNVLFGAFLFFSILAVITFLKLSIEHNDFSKYSQIIPLASANAEETCPWSDRCEINVYISTTGRTLSAAASQALRDCEGEVRRRLYQDFADCYTSLVRKCRAPCVPGLRPMSINTCRLINCDIIGSPEDLDPLNPNNRYYCEAEASASASIICAIEGTHSSY